MYRLTFRFYAALNDFLPPARRQVEFTHDIKERSSVKDAIESLGIPHPEIELILVNGSPVQFSYLIEDGDRVSVYPEFASLDIDSVTNVRPPQGTLEPSFILDVHLGRLAAYLRLLGFDTTYRNDHGDDELARLATTQDRILLTRDVGLLKRSAVRRGYWVRETAPRQQLVEVIRRFDLHASSEPFKRCLRCNGLIEQIEKERVLDQLPPRTREDFTEFFTCRNCGQIFWKGSHYERMKKLIADAVDIATLGRRETQGRD